MACINSHKRCACTLVNITEKFGFTPCTFPYFKVSTFPKNSKWLVRSMPKLTYSPWQYTKKENLKFVQSLTKPWKRSTFTNNIILLRQRSPLTSSYLFILLREKNHNSALQKCHWPHVKKNLWVKFMTLRVVPYRLYITAFINYRSAAHFASFGNPE